MKGSPAYRTLSALVHAAQPRARATWRRAMLRRGEDVTTSTQHLSCLVLAPHPDDETLGCGATIARKASLGVPVHVVVAADGRYAQKASALVSTDELKVLRAAEVAEACRRLGLGESELQQLGYEDTRLQQSYDDLVSDLVRTLRRLRPEEVLVASGRDHHPDHRCLNAAARAALSIVSYEGRVAEYPVWYWVDGPWTNLSSRPLVRRVAHLVSEPVMSVLRHPPELVSAGPYLGIKRAALEAYVTQVTNMTGEAEWQVMDEGFLLDFLMPFEPFFPVRR